MRRVESQNHEPISYERLQFLGDISSQWEQELRDRQCKANDQAHQRHLQEFVESISGEEYSRHTSASIREAAREFAVAITGRHIPNVCEGTWNPAKHPRRGGPPNAGWWAPTGSADKTRNESTLKSKEFWLPDTGRSIEKHSRFASGNRPSPNSQKSFDRHSGNRDIDDQQPFTKAQSSTHDGTSSYFVSASRPRGHHWVPQKVFGDLASKMTEKAYEIFRAGTESPELYHHANDTWNGVKHAQYSTALRELLEEWITANGGRIDEDAAKHFYSWIATGKTKNNKLLALLAKHKKAVATALKW